MKLELNHHLRPLTVILAAVSLYWIINKVAFISFIGLFLGLGLGAFFLDLDHLIYWLYLRPNLDESKIAQQALANRDYRSLLKLLESTHKNHTSLIFHHFFFQIILALVTVFVLTSSSGSFTKAFIVSLNLHLLIDEYHDFQTNPKHLQEWLFARESQQIPLSYLKYYLAVFTIFCFIFLYLLLKSLG